MNLLGLSGNEIDKVGSEPFTTSPHRLLSRMGMVRKKELHEVFNRIFFGSMPALYATEGIDRETFYASYVNTYLQRDIRDLTQVADEMKFLSFMTAVAARTARPVVYGELARDADISAPTAKQWLSVLHSFHIIALVQPYSNNVLKRVVKNPLLHFLDLGLCAYLLKWGSGMTLEKSMMAGPFFESWVFSEIYKSYLNAGKEPPLYYYRDKDQREIDLLIIQDGTLCPVEVKKSANPGRDALRHFKVLEPAIGPGGPGSPQQFKMEIGEGSVICMADDLLPLDERNWCVPAWLV